MFFRPTVAWVNGRGLASAPVRCTNVLRTVGWTDPGSPRAALHPRTSMSPPLRALLLLVSLAAACASAGTSSGPSLARAAALPDSALRAELVAIGNRDQALREEMSTLLLQSGSQRPDSVAVARITARVDSADRAHAARVREIVSQRGWPTRSQVGGEGVEAVFLVVQHAVHDAELQRRYLQHLTATFRENDRSTGEAIALLTDRLRVMEGKPQLYGTQVTIQGKDVVVDPIEDPSRVDQRRATLGLEPLAAYLRRLKDAYGIQ